MFEGEPLIDLQQAHNAEVLVFDLAA
jgi:hypothetical protein